MSWGPFMTMTWPWSDADTGFVKSNYPFHETVSLLC